AAQRDVHRRAPGERRPDRVIDVAPPGLARPPGARTPPAASARLLLGKPKRLRDPANGPIGRSARGTPSAHNLWTALAACGRAFALTTGWPPRLGGTAGGVKPLGNGADRVVGSVLRPSAWDVTNHESGALV